MASIGPASPTRMPAPGPRGGGSWRAAAARSALERPAASANARSNKPGRRESGYNAEPNAKGSKPTGYNGRSAEPQGRGSGPEAVSNARQPAPAAGNNNTRSNPPGSFPANMMEQGDSATTPSSRAGRGGGRAAPQGQPLTEAQPAYIGQNIGGDRFSRATARVKARNRGVTS